MIGRTVSAPCALSTLASCTGVQSALEPHGTAASEIADLFWAMTIAGTVIFVAFMALALYAARSKRAQHSMATARRLVVYGAVLAPTVLLALLLVYGLRMLPGQLAPAPDGSLRIHVSGEQWWWRVRYEPPGREPFETANEIRLPVGEPVQFELSSPDVIHSFWIPSLAGKVDMIPGRTTQLALTPTSTGEYRGACAEYCGASHAWMAFAVVVLEREEFEAWLDAQAAPAAPPADGARAAGERSFVENGCGACHTVRGTRARGVIGPDLTHVGSRRSLGAGLFPRSERAFARWIADTTKVKPGVHMPAFGMLPPSSLTALATYLESLK